MATIDELKVQITATADKFNKEINNVKKELNSLSSTSSSLSSKMSTGFVAVGSAIGNVIGNLATSAFRELASNMNEAVTRLDVLNNYTKVMSNLGISSGEANKSINALSDKLQGLPTKLDAAALSVQRLASANGNIGASTEMFLALNNAILAGGASTEIQSSAIEQLSQAYAKGKPDMMEWRTMLMAMPAQLKQVATEMGYASSSDLGEALRSGSVSMNDFMMTLVKLNKNGANGFQSFEEQARNATGGVATSIVNLKTAIQRGMANIMNVIGQTNISGFINGIASAVDTACKYIAAFVKVVITAINAVKALFGKANTALSSTSNSANNAANSVAGIGSSANDASKSIDGTTKAAKKLSKQLAAFDEMNVLKEPDTGDSDGGSGGGSSAGGVDLSGLEFDWSQYESEGTNAIDAIYKKMMSVFGKLDLSKWEKALNDFKKGALNLFDIIGAAGQSAWDRFFAPLLKYIAEDALPTYIGDIGVALQQLDFESFARGFETFFTGLYDFFKPVIDIFLAIHQAISYVIATLANWVIPPALSILGAALSVIGSLLSGIAEGFRNVFETVLVPVFTDISNFLAPVIEDIQRIATEIQNCEPLMNALRIAGEVLGTALGFAFTLVVNVIGVLVEALLVAIDFILNLPEYIRAFFENMWNIVQTIVTNIGNFFANVFNGIKNTVENIGNGIKNIFSNVWNTLKTGAQNAWDGIKNVFSTVANFFGSIFSNAWEAVKNVFSTGGRIFDGIKDGIVNAFKTVVNAIIIGINKVVAVPFNAINNALNGIRNIDIMGLRPFEWIHTINVPQIPLLATGGVTTGATLAMIGEAGSEAVLPLERNTGWMDTLANKINGEQHITVKIGEETILDKVIGGINDLGFMSGKSVIKI